jgi:hypothetical protein
VAVQTCSRIAKRFEFSASEFGYLRAFSSAGTSGAKLLVEPIKLPAQPHKADAVTVV